jgi:hypothetical protein
MSKKYAILETLFYLGFQRKERRRSANTSFDNMPSMIALNEGTIGE